MQNGTEICQSGKKMEKSYFAGLRLLSIIMDDI
jgi:hypothetical protein